jgi:hypothetical protein
MSNCATGLAIHCILITSSRKDTDTYIVMHVHCLSVHAVTTHPSRLGFRTRANAPRGETLKPRRLSDLDGNNIDLQSTSTVCISLCTCTYNKARLILRKWTGRVLMQAQSSLS